MDVNAKLSALPPDLQSWLGRGLTRGGLSLDSDKGKAALFLACALADVPEPARSATMRQIDDESIDLDTAAARSVVASAAGVTVRDLDRAFRTFRDGGAAETVPSAPSAFSLPRSARQVSRPVVIGAGVAAVAVAAVAVSVSMLGGPSHRDDPYQVIPSAAKTAAAKEVVGRIRALDPQTPAVSVGTSLTDPSMVTLVPLDGVVPPPGCGTNDPQCEARQKARQIRSLNVDVKCIETTAGKYACSGFANVAEGLMSGKSGIGFRNFDVATLLAKRGSVTAMGPLPVRPPVAWAPAETVGSFIDSGYMVDVPSVEAPRPGRFLTRLDIRNRQIVAPSNESSVLGRIPENSLWGWDTARGHVDLSAMDPHAPNITVALAGFQPATECINPATNEASTACMKRYTDLQIGRHPVRCEQKRGHGGHACTVAGSFGGIRDTKVYIVDLAAVLEAAGLGTRTERFDPTPWRPDDGGDASMVDRWMSVPEGAILAPLSAKEEAAMAAAERERAAQRAEEERKAEAKRAKDAYLADLRKPLSMAEYKALPSLDNAETLLQARALLAKEDSTRERPLDLLANLHQCDKARVVRNDFDKALLREAEKAALPSSRPLLYRWNISMRPGPVDMQKMTVKLGLGATGGTITLRGSSPVVCRQEFSANLNVELAEGIEGADYVTLPRAEAADIMAVAHRDGLPVTIILNLSSREGRTDLDGIMAGLVVWKDKDFSKPLVGVGNVAGLFPASEIGQ